MFDRDTLVIAYDTGRGEPRGSRARKADPAALGLGHCIDCEICVQVCPTGIDIRQGLQYECIGCAACIDGCDQVMDKMGYPRGLIRYSTETALEEKLDFAAILKRFVRPRTLVYTAILCAVVVAATVALVMRVPLKVDVIRDRGAMVREVEGRRTRERLSTAGGERHRIAAPLPHHRRRASRPSRGLRAGDRDGGRLHACLSGSTAHAGCPGAAGFAQNRDPGERRGRQRTRGEGREPCSSPAGRKGSERRAAPTATRREGPGTGNPGRGSSWRVRRSSSSRASPRPSSPSAAPTDSSPTTITSRGLASTARSPATRPPAISASPASCGCCPARFA